MPKITGSQSPNQEPHRQDSKKSGGAMKRSDETLPPISVNSGFSGDSKQIELFVGEKFKQKTPSSKVQVGVDRRMQTLKKKEEELKIKEEKLKKKGLKKLREGIEMKAEMEKKLNECQKLVKSGNKNPDLPKEIAELTENIKNIEIDIKAKDARIETYLKPVLGELELIQAEIKQIKSRQSTIAEFPQINSPQSVKKSPKLTELREILSAVIDNEKRCVEENDKKGAAICKQQKSELKEAIKKLEKEKEV